MTALAHDPTPTRRRHQERVAVLLDDLEARRQRLRRLAAGGARPAALRDLTYELRALRTELAAAVDTRRPTAGSARPRSRG